MERGFSVVQSSSHDCCIATPWTTGCQVSLFFTMPPEFVQFSVIFINP